MCVCGFESQRGLSLSMRGLYAYGSCGLLTRQIKFSCDQQHSSMWVALVLGVCVVLCCVVLGWVGLRCVVMRCVAFVLCCGGWASPGGWAVCHWGGTPVTATDRCASLPTALFSDLEVLLACLAGLPRPPC